jgi:HEAT repeat protein
LSCFGCCLVGGWLPKESNLKDKEPVPNQQVAQRKDSGKKGTNPQRGVEGPSELQLADRLFAAGDREEAVRKYKVLFAFAKKEEQAEMLTRIVELETAKGNLKEAKRWIESGLDLGLTPTFSTPGAAGLLVQVHADRDQKAAHALGRIGSDAREAVPMLMERARSDTSISVREAAAAALEKVRK